MLAKDRGDSKIFLGGKQEVSGIRGVIIRAKGPALLIANDMF